MKYYESCFEEYLNAVDQINLHPDLCELVASMPNRLQEIENMIIYGPPGIGKYSQCLNILKKYSPSGLKYDKQITAATDKQKYTYRISDIHYEIDMAMLGCNSKTLWYEIFFQIVDIVSVNTNKIGIIVCKNFHSIHSELLDSFYSYIQHYNHTLSNIKLKFILITENIGFIPANITNTCSIINIKRPSLELYKQVIDLSAHRVCDHHHIPPSFVSRISNLTKTCQPTNLPLPNSHKSQILNNISASDISNIKETKYFDLLDARKDDLPADLFNAVCDKIIRDTYAINTIDYVEYRDSLYNMLTYNLDVAECIWYILSHFIENDHLEFTAISEILEETYTFLKYYNNNYRPIYHLESIMFYIIKRLDISK
jgi:hypothetical protein